jgi:phosphohistidine phosphatase
MRLYVMRHGAAEDQSPSGQDSDRALSASGRERVQRVARALLDSEEAPLVVITSHLVRAVQTAEIVAVVTRLTERGGSVEVRRELAPSGDAVALARELTRDGRKRAMLVGHEPDLSALVAALVGRFDRSFDKSMVVGLQAAAAGATRLRFVLDPKSLRFDPDARD